MKTLLQHFISSSTLVGICLLASCQSGIESVNPQDSSSSIAKKGARIEASEESAADTYEFFFYVNGVRHNRGDLFFVVSGERFFVELRMKLPPSKTTLDRSVGWRANSWDYDNEYFKLLQTYDTGKHFETIAPPIPFVDDPARQADSRLLGRITASFLTPDRTRTYASEQKPVYINVIQF
jgi:hypothetical protein